MKPVAIAFAIALAIGAIPSIANASDARSLIQRWNEANNHCRGSDDARACANRELLDRQLAKRGWCFSTLRNETGGPEATWRPCNYFPRKSDLRSKAEDACGERADPADFPQEHKRCVAEAVRDPQKMCGDYTGIPCKKDPCSNAVNKADCRRRWSGLSKETKADCADPSTRPYVCERMLQPCHANVGEDRPAFCRGK